MVRFSVDREFRINITMATGSHYLWFGKHATPQSIEIATEIGRRNQPAVPCGAFAHRSRRLLSRLYDPCQDLDVDFLLRASYTVHFKGLRPSGCLAVSPSGGIDIGCVLKLSLLRLTSDLTIRKKCLV